MGYGPGQCSVLAFYWRMFNPVSLRQPIFVVAAAIVFAWVIAFVDLHLLLSQQENRLSGQGIWNHLSRNSGSRRCLVPACLSRNSSLAPPSQESLQTFLFLKTSIIRMACSNGAKAEAHPLSRVYTRPLVWPLDPFEHCWKFTHPIQSSALLWQRLTSRSERETRNLALPTLNEVGLAALSTTITIVEDAKNGE